MDIRGPLGGGDAKDNLSHIRPEPIRHEAHSLNGPNLSDVKSQTPESEINELVNNLKQVPEVREELVTQTIAKLRDGELLTRASAEKTAQAILELMSTE